MRRQFLPRSLRLRLGLVEAEPISSFAACPSRTPGQQGQEGPIREPGMAVEADAEAAAFVEYLRKRNLVDTLAAFRKEAKLPQEVGESIPAQHEAAAKSSKKRKPTPAAAEGKSVSAVGGEVEVFGGMNGAKSSVGGPENGEKEKSKKKRVKQDSTVDAKAADIAKWKKVFTTQNYDDIQVEDSPAADVGIKEEVPAVDISAVKGQKKEKKSKSAEVGESGVVKEGEKAVAVDGEVKVATSDGEAKTSKKTKSKKSGKSEAQGVVGSIVPDTGADAKVLTEAFPAGVETADVGAAAQEAAKVGKDEVLVKVKSKKVKRTKPGIVEPVRSVDNAVTESQEVKEDVEMTPVVDSAVGEVAHAADNEVKKGVKVQKAKMGEDTAAKPPEAPIETTAIEITPENGAAEGDVEMIPVDDSKKEAGGDVALGEDKKPGKAKKGKKGKVEIDILDKKVASGDVQMAEPASNAEKADSRKALKGTLEEGESKRTEGEVTGTETPTPTPSKRKSKKAKEGESKTAESVGASAIAEANAIADVLARADEVVNASTPVKEESAIAVPPSSRKKSKKGKDGITKSADKQGTGSFPEAPGIANGSVKTHEAVDANGSGPTSVENGLQKNEVTAPTPSKKKAKKGKASTIGSSVEGPASADADAETGADVVVQASEMEIVAKDKKRKRNDEDVKEYTAAGAAGVPDGIESVPKKKAKMDDQKTSDIASSRSFQRVDPTKVEILDPRLTDNSYWGKGGAETGWGAKAEEVLGKVRGKDFRHEKTKKKRGSYKGGAIDLQSHSVKFSYPDDE